MTALFEFDANCGYNNLIGVDEAGRGPLAGPVFAAAVKLSKDAHVRLAGLDDSKKLSAKKRKELFVLIKEYAEDFAVAFAVHTEIDEINIHNASLLAMKRAVEKLKTPWEFSLIDGRFIIPGIEPVRQKAIVKGDSQSACIAAASILAKVSRDELMEKYHLEFPQYEFARHKGYPTALHIQRLKQYGPSPLHRMSFCKKILSSGQ